MTDTTDFHLPADMPLAIDVDGTLLRSDITQEMFWLGFLRYPWLAPKILGLVKNDRPALKALLMPRLIDVWDPEHLPYNPRVMQIARDHHAAGGEVILCSGSEGSVIARIADHFDFIDAGFGTSDTLNLVQGNKARFLKDKYPDGFCYIGNSTQDFTVWPDAALALAIAPPKGVDAIKGASGQDVIVLEPREGEGAALFEATRPTLMPYYALVIALSLVGAVLWQDLPLNPLDGLSAFMSLWLLFAGGFVLNDIWDVPRDRSDSAKRFRPLASGRLSCSLAALFGIGFTGLGVVIFAMLPTPIKAITALSGVILAVGFAIKGRLSREKI